MWRRVRMCRFFTSRMCLSLYDYQSKASRYRKGLTYLKNRATTNQKPTTDSPNPKRREHKHNGQKEKQKKGREIKSTGKQSLKWQ